MTDAVIRDAEQYTVGYVSPNGFVYDVIRNVLGYVNHQGAIRNAHLRTVGYSDEQGQIYDINWQLLGSVEQQGVIKNVQGNIVGYVEGGKDMMAYYAQSAAFFVLTRLTP